MSEEKNIGAEAESDKKIYEIGFQIIPSVPGDKIGEEYSAIKEIIEKNGAVIISDEMPKMRPLAYEMRKESAGKYQKYNTAYFGWVKFESGAEGVLVIDAFFKKTPTVLRHLLIKTVRENTMTAPKIPLYKKAEAPKMKIETEGDTPEKVKISETELDKAIDDVIGG